MISQRLPAALARRNIHYGWAVVAVTFLTALITAGTVGAPGVFIIPLQKEFGWTTAAISSALSIRFILFGLMMSPHGSLRSPRRARSSYRGR
jgi:predicted branched-subunit amino acid permease